MMISKSSFLYISVFSLSLCNFIGEKAWSQQSPVQQNYGQQQQSATAYPKFYGDFILTTNAFEQGVSTSNNSMAMSPELGYEWANGKVGFWGSNVQFPSNTESLNIRLFGWYRFVFSQTRNLQMRFDMSKFFKSSARDGNIYHFDINLDVHHYILEQNTNWFGSSTGNLWLAYARDWKSWAGSDYKLEVGYNMISAPAYASYFAVKTGFGYKYYDFYYSLLMSYNSASTQFTGGIADLGISLQLEAKF